MAGRENHVQDTIPVKYEAQLASIDKSRRVQKLKEPLTISELILNTFGGICFLAVANFLFEEAVKYLRQLGQ